MSQSLAEENLIRRYLLGELSQNKQDEFEKRLLADPEFFRTSRIIEGELLDDYVLGVLSESDRISLESGLLMSAQQQRRVKLIRLLRLKSNGSVLTRYFRSHTRVAWAA